MKKLLSFVLALLAVTSAAQTTIVGGGGGFASGSTASGCTAYSLVYVDSSGNLACALAPVNGSVTTVGRGTFSVLDSISGSSATSNFLNITAAFPATLSAATSAIYSTVAFDNDNQQQAVIRAVSTGTGAAANYNAAVWGDSQNSGNTGFGGYFIASGAPTTGVGVWGTASGGTSKVGGFFALAVQSVPTSSAALIADNVSVAANIFEARDNGTAVFTIADGGAITASPSITGTWTWNTNQQIKLGSTTGDAAINGVTTLTPDAPIFETGTVSNSFHIEEGGDRAFDFNNGSCGTSACTDPNLIIHSRNQDTQEYISLNHDGIGGSIKAGNSTAKAGEIALARTVTLTEAGGAETVITITNATTQSFGLELSYRVHATDATPDYAIREGSLKMVCVNNATVVTCTKDATAQTDDESVLINTTAKTLTYAIATDVATANVAKITFNIDSDMTVTSAFITFTAILNGLGTIS